MNTMRRFSVTILLTSLLACMCALLAIWLPVAEPSPPPLFIQFIGHTNYTGERFAVFSVTNRGAIRQQFHAFDQTPGNPEGWQVFGARSEAVTNAYWRYLPPGESAQFSVKLFLPRVPYRLSLEVKQPDSKWRQWKRTWRDWCVTHHLPRLEQLLFKDYNNQIITGPEVQQ